MKPRAHRGNINAAHRYGKTIAASLSVVLLWSMACSASAATYYVATTGDDNASGTRAQPWRTLHRAAAGANPGDTVLVATGVYRERVLFERSGFAGRKIVFKNLPGHFPVIDGQGIPMGRWDMLVGFHSAGYVRLEGFEIRNSAAYNLWIGGESHHLEIVGLTVHDGAYSGIWIEGPQRRPAMSLIYGNKVYKHKSGGITVWLSDGGYYRIEDNEVFGNLGIGNYDGIQIGGGNGGTHHVVVKNNVVHDNGSEDKGEDPIDVGGHGINHHYLVEGNLAYNGIGSFKVHSGVPLEGSYQPAVSGFHIARFNTLVGHGFVAYDFPNPPVIYNNTFVDAGQFLMLYGQDRSKNQSLGDRTYTGGDTGRMNFKNNLFFQEKPSTSYALLLAGPEGSTIDVSYGSVRLQNNMYKLSPAQKIIWGNAEVIFGPPVNASVFSRYQKSSAPNHPDTGSLLTNATWTQMFAGPQDYHLAAGSPAIDKGTSLTKAINAGTNSTILVVDRASYFQDGYCVNGECLNTPDSIVIGNSAPVRIKIINDVTNTITLTTPVSWTAGSAVTLPYIGSAPDIGAFEYGSTEERSAGIKPSLPATRDWRP